MEEHLDEPPCLKDLARRAYLSPFHFHRLFRAAVGESVYEYLRRLRLERAAQQLTVGGAPVARVARTVGYNTHEAFTRAFAGHFGMPPGEFRKRHASVEASFLA